VDLSVSGGERETPDFQTYAVGGREKTFARTFARLT
jgi:hypothetical protein